MDILQCKKDFPIFLYHPDLVYLDTNATALKPKQVIEKEKEYYEQYTSNIHRGIYKNAEKATAEYEETRKLTAQYINAESDEVIFTRGTTEAINTITEGIEKNGVKGNIVTTIMEHHSNFVPWQQLAKRKKLEFKVIPITDDGLLEFVNPDGITVNETILRNYLNDTTSIFAFTAVSNVLGTINPVAKIAKAVRNINPKTIIVVDAAQAAPHAGLNVKEWDADYVAFSAHKLCGPTGVGVLWGKKENLNNLPPFQFGGEMVLEVTNNETTFKDIPHKFEAGTPNIAGVIAFQEAIKYMTGLGIENIRKHEMIIVEYAITKLKREFGESINILGTQNAELRAGVLTFNFENFHSHDIAQLLDDKNIAVRAGHHCAMPLHNHLDLVSSTRASFYMYTTKEDIDRLVEGLHYVHSTLTG